MMKISLTNDRSQTVELTGNEDKYQVVKVAGVDPGQAVINSTAVVGVDGTQFNSARLPNRSITITLKLNGDVAGNRRALYQKFPNMMPVTITLENEATATATGHVSGISCPLYDRQEIMQLTILCDDPFFYGADWTGSKSWTGELGALTVQNNGDFITGAVIEIAYDGQFNELAVYTAEGSLYLNYSFSSQEGLVRIDTGEKTISIVEDGGTPVDGVPFLSLHSIFFTLAPGASSLSVACDDNLSEFSVSVTVPTKFGGM